LKEAFLQQICSNKASSSHEEVVISIEKKYKYNELKYYDLYEVLMSLLNKVSKFPNKLEGKVIFSVVFFLHALTHIGRPNDKSHC